MFDLIGLPGFGIDRKIEFSAVRNGNSGQCFIDTEPDGDGVYSGRELVANIVPLRRPFLINGINKYIHFGTCLKHRHVGPGRRGNLTSAKERTLNGKN